MQHEIGQLRKNIADNLRFYLAITGMTQKELAKRSGVSASTINRLCNNAENVRIDNFERIALALGTTSDILVKEDGYKEALDQLLGRGKNSHLEERRSYGENLSLSSMEQKKKKIFDRILSCENWEETAEIYLIIKRAVEK